MKTQTNTYPIDAPYGNGIIHYFNIVDKGESTEEGWMQYEADYEIVDNIVEREETILYTKYALLSPSEYLKLNEAISERLGFNINESTERYTSMTSQFTVEGLMVMEITVEVQQKCADILPELVDKDTWTIAEEQPTEIQVTDLTEEQQEWVKTHAEATNTDIIIPE